MSSMAYDQQQAGDPSAQIAQMLGLGGGGQAPEEASADPNDLLQQILELAAQYKQVEEDPQDLLTVEKVTTLVQQLIAANQKEADGMMSGKVTPRAIRKATGGAY